jgi:WD40 repeat protein
MKSIAIANNALYAICSDGEFIYTGGLDKIVGKWDVNLNPSPPNIRTESAVYALAVDKNSRMWLGLSDSALHIIDLTEKRELKNIVQHKKSIYSIQHLANGKTITSDGAGGIAVWDNSTFELERFIPFSDKKIRSINKIEAGFLVCDAGGGVSYLDEWMNVIEESCHHEKACNTALKVGTKIYSAGWDGHIYMLNDSLGVDKKIPAHTGAIYQILDYDGFIFSASRDGSIKKWDSDLNFISKVELHPSKRSVNAISILNNKIYAVSDRPYLYRLDLTQDFQ